MGSYGVLVLSFRNPPKHLGDVFLNTLYTLCCPAEKKNTGGCINDGCDDITFICHVNFLQDCFHPQVTNGLHWYPSVVSEFVAKSIATTLRPASILDHDQEIPIRSKTHNTNLKMSGV